MTQYPVLIEYARMEPSQINVIRSRVRTHINHRFRDVPASERPRVIMSGEKKYLRFIGLTKEDVERICREQDVPGKPYYDKPKERPVRLETISLPVVQTQKGLETVVQKEEPVVEKKERKQYRPRIKYSVLIPEILKTLRIIEEPMLSGQIIQQLKLGGIDIGTLPLSQRLNGMIASGLIIREGYKYRLK